MAIDLRQKACANEACASFKKKKYSASYEHCPSCGQKLIFVCTSPGCYKPLDLNEPKHVLCESCSAKYNDMKDQALDVGKKLVVLPVAALAKKDVRDFVKNTYTAIRDTLLKK